MTKSSLPKEPFSKCKRRKSKADREAFSAKCREVAIKKIISRDKKINKEIDYMHLAELWYLVKEPAPLKKGVSENVLLRSGSPCDDNYIDNLKLTYGKLI